MDPAVLTVTAERGDEHALDVTRFDHVVAVDDLGHEHVAIVDRQVQLRLDVVAGTLFRGPVALRVHLDCTAATGLKLDAFDRLLRLIGLRDGGRRPPREDKRFLRLVEGLRVIDALAQGASLSEVATMLAGEDVSFDWPGDGEHRKSAVRRRVALARRMLAAGPAGILGWRV